MRPLVSTWEQRKFSDVVDVCSGKDYKHLKEGSIPVYGTGGFMTSVDEALSYDRDAVGIGRKGTIDKPYLLKAPFWTVDTLFYAIPKSDIGLEFVHCSFLNVDWKSKDESTGLPSLSKEAINETIALVPSFNEQSQLGEFFSNLDSLITLHQRKCQYCGLYGYLSWEQRKLGDVVTRHDNLRIPIAAKDRIPGDAPYYGANGIQDYVEGYTHEGEFVLVAEDGASDLDNYPVQLISGLSWVNNHAHVIKAIPDVAQNRFIMHLIKSMDIASYLVGGTRSKLNAEVLMEIEIKLPSNSEQIHIGALLSTLDSLITLHQ